ncbi:MAG: hypothetical protein RLN87_09240 [Parasphingopyxis sp.]|uniref:hypothetical protein n=1 Tax=Parasphingopyxis sp. TaxID=1920299 RepID=UPI0032EC7673
MDYRERYEDEYRQSQGDYGGDDRRAREGFGRAQGFDQEYDDGARGYGQRGGYGEGPGDYGSMRGGFAGGQGYGGYAGGAGGYGDGGGQNRGYERDPHYTQWRLKQMDQFDRDYREFRSEQQDNFDRRFNEWRANRDERRSGSQAKQGGSQTSKTKEQAE